MDLQLQHWIDPARVNVQGATAAGSFVALLSSRKYRGLHAITLFVVGQVTAYYWTLPLAEAFHWNMNFYGPIGFSIGAVGMLIWGGIVALAQNLYDDPKGTLTWAWRTWKGNSNASDSDSIPPGN